MMKKFWKKKEHHPTTRRQKYLMLSGATTFLIVVALVLLNVLTAYLTEHYPISVDLTPEKVFQLTDQSKEYLSELSEPVLIQVLTSESNFVGSDRCFPIMRMSRLEISLFRVRGVLRR